MSAHTPGPWSVPHFAEPDVNCACKYILTGGMMGAVASVHCSGDGDDWQAHGDNPGFKEAVANAHLIASAPDLLASLQEAVRLFESYALLANPEKFDREKNPGLWVNGARAIIAKATGAA